MSARVMALVANSKMLPGSQNTYCTEALLGREGVCRDLELSVNWPCGGLAAMSVLTIIYGPP